MLSNRVRPNVEAAPWVIEEIKELEKELLEQARLNGMGSEREARLLAQIAELERENLYLRHQLGGVP